MAVETVELVLATQPVIIVDVDVDECVDADGDAVPDVSTVMAVEHLLDRLDLRTDYQVHDAIDQLDRQLLKKKLNEIPSWTPKV